MRWMKKAALAIAFLLWSIPAFCQCSGQFANNTVCGNSSGSKNLPGPIAITPGVLYPIAGGTVLGNPTASTAVPQATNHPILGIPGTSLGQLGLAGSGSGTATIQPQAAAGTPTLVLPNTSGTFAVNASSPLILSATTGGLTCPTCVTSSGGGAITGVS